MVVEPLRVRVVRAMACALGLDVDDLGDDLRLADDLGLDELAVLELVQAVEQATGLCFSEAAIDALHTCGDVVATCVTLTAPIAVRPEPVASVRITHRRGDGAIVGRMALTPYALEDLAQAAHAAHVEIWVAPEDRDTIASLLARLHAPIVLRIDTRPPPLAEADDAEAPALAVVAELATRIGTLLHELQQERGLTCLELAAPAPALHRELTVQREATANAVDALGDFFARTETQLPDAVRAPAARALGALAQLDVVRRLADAGAPLGRVIHAATWLDEQLVAVAASLASVTPDAEWGRIAKGYLALLRARESTALERAELAGAAATGTLAPGQDAVLAALLAAQRAFLTLFAESAAASVDLPLDEAERVESLVLEHPAPRTFPVDRDTWNRAMAGKLACLRALEDVQLAALRQRAALTAGHA
ncbi:MAG: nitrate- and nitrite sensing domain-containing protein [bacterium]|nr:nitrate- and nitrite sensing domain-containing protein [bacterium]